MAFSSVRARKELGGGGPSVASWMLPKDVCPNSHDPPEVFLDSNLSMSESKLSNYYNF